MIHNHPVKSREFFRNPYRNLPDPGTGVVITNRGKDAFVMYAVSNLSNPTEGLTSYEVGSVKITQTTIPEGVSTDDKENEQK